MPGHQKAGKINLRSAKQNVRTDAVKDRLPGAPQRFGFIGDVVLRGKTQPVGVYSVE